MAVRWRAEALVQGYPGATTCHGGLGWSTVGLARQGQDVVLIDTGGYMQRTLLEGLLADRGVSRTDVTAVLVTHCHCDHMVNWPMFPRARIHVPRSDVEWALAQPVGFWYIPEFHVQRVAEHQLTRWVADGDEPLPGVRVVATPGHTPGHVTYLFDQGDRVAVFCGDAAKNLAELATGTVDMTVDAEASADSAAKIRAIAADHPGSTVFCGHDRLLAVEDGQVVPRSPVRAAITAAFGPDQHITFDLSPPGSP